MAASIQQAFLAKVIIIAIVVMVAPFAILGGALRALRGVTLGITALDLLSIVMGLGLLGACALVLRRGRRAGEARQMLGRAPHSWLYGALAAAFVAILLARLLNPHLRQPSALVFNLGWVAFCLASIADRPRVGERGIVAGALFLPWGRIDSYEVRTPRDGDRIPGASAALLTVRYHGSPDPSAELRATTIRCAAGRHDIELLLARYVRTEQGHRRWHARRIGASAPLPAPGPAQAPASGAMTTTPAPGL